MNVKNILGAGVMACAGLFASLTFGESAYPSKPVTMVVGFPAGGPTDFLTRLVAQEFSHDFKQTFVVINKPGANSSIAMTTVATAARDGYTLLTVPVGLALNEHLYDKVNYSLKDFAPIGLIAKMPNVIVVNKKLGIATLKQLIDYAKANPGKVSFAAPSAGSSAHLSGELLRNMSKADLTHIPFAGDAPALMAVMGGVVDVGIMNLTTAAEMIRTEKFQPLAVTTARRAPSFPEIPTIAESGYPGYEVSSYFGLAAPAGTPSEIIGRLNKSLNKALEKPEVVAQFTKMGFIIEPSTPDSFKAFLISENKKWGAVIKESGMKRLSQ